MSELTGNRIGTTAGKTHIVIAACRAGYSICITSLDDMVCNLKAVEETGRLTRKLGTCLRPGVHVVDEADRLLHHCEAISINGPSYRLKNRLKAIEHETEVA
ncbi:ATP-binding protein [Streptomyces formicae]|uniref:ATP-binding protein n=1 Tax=Streptomyces formicae TaxID=1616117 RepID=A0ABY3WID9_9ACTN|nr:ATP-binding protein [Streptomyces formicae]UNM10296.1 ATP-binding protein [Streptomyces formicae]